MRTVLSTYALDTISFNVYKFNQYLAGKIKSNNKLKFRMGFIEYSVSYGYFFTNIKYYIKNKLSIKKFYSFLAQHLSIQLCMNCCIVSPLDAASDLILFLFSFVISNLKYALSLSILSHFYYLFYYILINIFKFNVLNKINKTKDLYITFNI
jgi:hypothetical protein